MLRTVFFIQDIKSRYRIRSDNTARKYMHEMGATGNPLFVTEDMVLDWELSKRKPCWTGKTIPVPEGLKIPRRK